MFVLIVNAGDPLADLRESRDPNRDNLIRLRTETMGLDLPWYVRYWHWLRGVGGCLYGQCDLGTNINGSSVNSLLAGAAASTLRLVVLATLLSIVIGVTLGIVTAIRQYSGFDYAVTFMAFLFFSLPVFWAAVLLKEFAAIGFNNWLVDPRISPTTMIVTAVIGGLVLQLATGGSLKRRLASFGGAAVFIFAALFYFDAVTWFRYPSVGLPVFILTGVGIGALTIAMSTGFSNKRVRNSVATTVVAGSVIYGVLRGFIMENGSWTLLFGCLVLSIVVAVAAGYAWGGFSKKVSVQMAVITASVMSFIAFVDLMLSNWSSFLSIKSRPIPTIGSQTPNLNGDFWQLALDKGASLILPTVVLTLISIASYTRYTRASMLEVMNQDYIRTARAKGLSERKVITKHAFRNSLIPLTTIVAFDFAALIGGAVITETVFGWKGMGELFRAGLDAVDPAPVMAFYLVTGAAAVIMNMLADIAYAFLDPRITR